MIDRKNREVSRMGRCPNYRRERGYSICLENLFWKTNRRVLACRKRPEEPRDCRIFRSRRSGSCCRPLAKPTAKKKKKKPIKAESNGRGEDGNVLARELAREAVGMKHRVFTSIHADSCICTLDRGHSIHTQKPAGFQS